MNQKDVDIQQVELMASRGLTFDQLAASLGISVRTLYSKREQFAEVADAVKRGRAKGIAAVANKLYQKALKGDNVAMIFFLKAVAGWKEGIILEHQIPQLDDGKPKVEALTYDDSNLAEVGRILAECGVLKLPTQRVIDTESQPLLETGSESEADSIPPTPEP